MELQQRGKVYRGIKLTDSVRLYKKDGTFNRQIKSALDNFINKLKEKGHKVLSEYTNSATKILIDFDCIHEPHWITPNDYNQGYGCPKCGGTSSIQAEEEFKRLLEQNGHKILSEYKTAKIHVLIDFNCGHEPHWINPNNYKSGYGCPKCSGKSSSQAKEYYYQEVDNAGYKLLGEYKNAFTKVKLQCDNGHVIQIKPNNFTSSKARCLKCAGHDKEQAEEGLRNLMKENGHELLSEYINTMTKVLIDFKCGHKSHWMMPYVYKQGQRCPLCRESRGERIIREYLESNGIAYIHQFKFPNNSKSYDFYLPFENAIVEVHGIQHYEETKIFHHHTYKTFEDEKRNDRSKEEYAKEMGCRYTVVDYREHNPELALQRFIVAYKQLKESKS
ncbi:putative CHY-type Zn-finger protein [Peribacillus simplex]